MEVLPAGLFIDVLPTCLILETLAIPDLRSAAAVNHGLRLHAAEICAVRLLELYKKLRVLPKASLPPPGKGLAASRVSQLSLWSSVSAKTELWLSAQEESLILKRTPHEIYGRPDNLHVQVVHDLSGRGRCASATNPTRMPTFMPDALGPGLGALEFDGASLLCTKAFTTPLPQPLTLILVARARGDTTLVDSLTASSARFELCHGYPKASSDFVATPEVCMSANGSGSAAPAMMLRGSTKSTNEWHVYTAIYDGSRSAMYVDGRKEASGKSVGTSSLDGLRIGCDHTSTFFLKGAVAELRLFSCHLGDEPRSQIEAAMQLRYGLTPAGKPPTTTPSKLRGPRMSSWLGCIPSTTL